MSRLAVAAWAVATTTGLVALVWLLATHPAACYTGGHLC